MFRRSLAIIIVIALSVLKCIFAVNLQYIECVCKVQTLISLFFFNETYNVHIFVVTYILFFHLSVFSHKMYCFVVLCRFFNPKNESSAADIPSSFFLNARYK